MLIDIGANLTNRRFDADIDKVIERARSAIVKQIVVTGTNIGHSEAAHQLTLKYPGTLFSTVGMHPHHAKDWKQDNLINFDVLIKKQSVVAVGECGLDFNRNYSPAAEQIHCFEGQLDFASSCGKPVFLHQRDAHEKFVKILTKYRSGLVAVVVHCFTGTENELAAYLDLDCHIGITGWICDERRGRHLHDFIDRIPANRLMVETDAPYLLPRTLSDKPKNRRNEPMYLPHVVEKLAQLRGQRADELGSMTTENAKSFFNLPSLSIVS